MNLYEFMFERSLFALFVQTVSGQSFVNLDFEQAGFYVSPTPVNGWGDSIDPNWHSMDGR